MPEQLTESEGVRFRTDGAVGFVTFDRPRQRNALTLEMAEELARICRQVNGNPELRVLVLRGEGGAFVAGMDISEFGDVLEGRPLSHSSRMDTLFDAVENLRIPTIVAIDGAAVGAGAAIAACCDLRIGTPRARFGFPIARTLGNALSPRNLVRLTALVGVARVKQMLFTARLLDAREMLACGLLNELVDTAETAEFDAAVRAYADSVAALAPLTLRATKAVIRRIEDLMTPDDALDAVALAYSSRDFREALAAFAEKRRPEWRGE